MRSPSKRVAAKAHHKHDRHARVRQAAPTTAGIPMGSPGVPKNPGVPMSMPPMSPMGNPNQMMPPMKKGGSAKTKWSKPC